MSDDKEIKDRLASLERGHERLGNRQEILEHENRALATKVGEVSVDARIAKETAEAASRQSGEALSTSQSTHRLLTQHVDHVVGQVEQRITTHLKQQDEHLAAQDASSSARDQQVSAKLDELHRLELERSAREKAESETKAAAHSAAKEAKHRRNDRLKNVATLVAILGGAGGAFAVARQLGIWLIQEFHRFF